MKVNEEKNPAIPSSESSFLALASREFSGLGRYMDGLKCDTLYGYCACGGYHYPLCTCGDAKDVHGGTGDRCAVKSCKCVHYEQDHSWSAGSPDIQGINTPA